MSDLIPKIGLAIEGYKARQQDIIGLGHRAYKDLFIAANAAMLTSVVKGLISRSYSEMVTPNSPRTSLLAAVSQQHSEIIAGCRVLTEDEGILSALIEAANAATTESLQLIYAEKQKDTGPSVAVRRPRKSDSGSESEPGKKKKVRSARTTTRRSKVPSMDQSRRAKIPH
jgi:hypothetical protein